MLVREAFARWRESLSLFEKISVRLHDARKKRSPELSACCASYLSWVGIPGYSMCLGEGIPPEKLATNFSIVKVLSDANVMFARSSVKNLFTRASNLPVAPASVVKSVSS
uniref:Uncharacterized protein n=1 Tax=Grammatophora oceanica TaxID=210454 RepID=A0A7S1Y7A7_9STRA